MVLDDDGNNRQINTNIFKNADERDFIPGTYQKNGIVMIPEGPYRDLQQPFYSSPKANAPSQSTSSRDWMLSK